MPVVAKNVVHDLGIKYLILDGICLDSATASSIQIPSTTKYPFTFLLNLVLLANKYHLKCQLLQKMLYMTWA